MVDTQRPQPSRRAGFTLVEVALAVAVGLIVLGGAVLGYQAAKRAAADAAGRERVALAQTIIEEYGAVNMGRYPTSSTGGAGFGLLWQAKHPADYNLSPWGGATKNAKGAIERAPVVGGASAASATSFSTVTSGFTPGVASTQVANLLYQSVSGTGWATASHPQEAGPVAVRNYAISIFDHDGMPYFALRGGR